MRLPAGRLVNVAELPADHPAALYLERRGVDRQELGRTCGWLYCADSPDSYVSRRLLIPLRHEEYERLLLVGYQTRAIDGHSLRETPKYWTAPGTPKSRMVYNLHNARHYSFIVVTEGVFDAARIGLDAVSLLGRTMSATQLALIRGRGRGATVAIMLDADAYDVARQQAEVLRASGVRAFAVQLESGDPGDLPRETLRELAAKHSAQLRS
jgi:hypothetical protein